MHKSLRPLAVIVSFAAMVGCGSNEQPYKAQPAWSGPRPNIPSPPALPTTPIKDGSGKYTVYGAIHQLRSEYHAKDVTKDPITLQGYIVDSNISTAPDCAVHPTGKEDPQNCTSEIPSFYIADNKGDAKGQKIRVIGWARNFAVVYDAMKAYANATKEKPPKELVKDLTLNVDVPFPLPAVGAKVVLTGKYGTAATSGSGMVADPESGVFTLQKIEYTEPAPDLAAFPKKLSAYPGK